MNNLAKLIEPVLTLVCETFVFEHNQAQVSAEYFDARLRQCFADIAGQCRADSALALDYSHIEKPLYFFVDYVVKENGFACSADYQGLGRSVNELSGDEKFFDLLDEMLSSVSEKELIYPYFLFLALGFDGMLKFDHKQLRSYLDTLSERLGLNRNQAMPELCGSIDHLTAPRKDKSDKSFFRRSLGISLLVLLGAFIINNLCFFGAAYDYADAVDDAMAAVAIYAEENNLSASGADALEDFMQEED